MKTVITSCSIWDFFGYKWLMDPRSKIKRSQLRLAPFLPKPLFILSDQFFDFGSIFKCYTQRMERFNYISKCRTLS